MSMGCCIVYIVSGRVEWRIKTQDRIEGIHELTLHFFLHGTNACVTNFLRKKREVNVYFFFYSNLRGKKRKKFIKGLSNYSIRLDHILDDIVVALLFIDPIQAPLHLLSPIRRSNEYPFAYTDDEQRNAQPGP